VQLVTRIGECRSGNASASRYANLPGFDLSHVARCGIARRVGSGQRDYRCPYGVAWDNPRAAQCFGDKTYLNLLPHVRASWTLRGRRPEVPTPGENRKVTVPRTGAVPAPVGIGGCLPDLHPAGGVLYLLVGRVWTHGATRSAPNADGLSRYRPAGTRCSVRGVQQDSNLRSRLRRALLGGLVTWGSGPLPEHLGPGSRSDA